MLMYIILRYARSLQRRLLISRVKTIREIEEIPQVYPKEYLKTSLKNSTNKKQKQDL
jgi:hypothetical protein